ncbi:MAG: tRNA (adenosine(37)-N6)-threonylcarbamoyltransferase complex ATPase subunit type 1 TsaE [Bacilli bacterium]
MKQSFELRRIEDIQPFVNAIMPWLTLGTLVTLQGPLGVGKTTLVQAIAKQLGVFNRISSPTFTIMKMYPLERLNGRLLHVDAYRLETQTSIGLEDEMGEDTITMIEWPEKLNPLPFSKKIVHLTLRFKDEQTRQVDVETVTL